MSCIKPAAPLGEMAHGCQPVAVQLLLEHFPFNGSRFRAQLDRKPLQAFVESADGFSSLIPSKHLQSFNFSACGFSNCVGKFSLAAARCFRSRLTRETSLLRQSIRILF
jgi:hypothetical protein